MIYTSEKGIKIVMFVFLICLFIFIIYFIREVKRVESIYDELWSEPSLSLK